ncbi:MAG: tetratricopeptide repeat protein [Alphaproteobacteria bacterium]|nr:tetratricopeptide repeat protein [Alphaproteobacteria bacterium]
MRALLVLLALAAGPAFAQEDELAGAGLDPISRNFFLEARAQERAGAWSRAATAYSVVVNRDPTCSPAVLGLGRVREQMGDVAGAEATYRTLPMDADAVEALALLVQEERPAEAVELYRRLRALRLGQSEPYRLEAAAAVAAEDYDAAIAALQRYVELDGAAEAPEPTSELFVELAVALKEADRRDEARDWFGRYLARWPEGDRAEEVEARLERMDVEDAAEHLAIGGAVELDPAERARLEEARRAIAAGQRSRARQLVADLIEVAPRSPDVWALQGDLLVGGGDIAEGEQAYLTALALDPEEPTWRVRLGRLLAERYAGRRHREALEELRVALTLRPAWTELHYEVGRLQIELGEAAEAAESLRAYLAAHPQGEHAADAAQLLEDLARTRPEPPAVAQLVARLPEGVPEEAWDHFKLAQVYLRERGDDAKAREEVERALALAPDYVDALNLLASLELRAGDHAAAQRTYQRSLEVEPDQPLVVLAVGEALREAGAMEAAEQRFREAADLGAEDAWFALARLADQEGRWMDARALLDQYFARASGGRVHDQALALRETLQSRYQATVGGAAGAAALAVGLPLGWVVRRRTGATLTDLLERHPEVYHDVASVLSRMRHEVIKHNTTVLPTAADALERGDWDPAVVALDRLLGRAGQRADAEHAGIVDRWWANVADLEAIGGRCGLRLNLKHKDPMIAPMCRAFRELTRLGRRVRPGRSGPAPRLADALRRISDALNQDGYQALGALIREVCVLSVDEALLRRCWALVCAEPGFVGQRMPDLALAVEGGPIPVKIFRQEMEDIVVNLLRNAASVVLEEQGPDAARVGVALFEDIDPITGLEWAQLRFRDNAHSTLTDDMIRGRYIARGLGLTVDLVDRNQGSVRVEPEPGWSKAIVVRLPRAEPPEESE